MFIKSIGNTYLNNIGFDLHENKDGTAAIRPIKLGRDFPSKYWIKFDSLELAQEYIDSFDAAGAELVHAMKQDLL